MQTGKKSSRISIVVGLGAFMAIAIVAPFVLGGLGGGKEKFMSPSTSGSDSRRRGLFIKEFQVIALNGGAPGPQDVWLEDVYEMYETIPIRKQKVGVRLCVSFGKSGLLQSKVFSDHEKSGMIIKGRHRVDTASRTVFVYRAATATEFDGLGTLWLYESLAMEPLFSVEISSSR